MFDNNLKKFVKKFPILWNLLRRFKDNLNVLSRLKDVFMMMILFHVWPKQVYRFSTRRLLPKKKNRFAKNKRPLIPYDLVKSKSNQLPTMDEVNAIGRGTSFNLNDLKKIEGPTFLLSFWNPLRLDNNGNIIYLYQTQRTKDMAPTIGENISSFQHSYKITHLKNLKEFRRKNLTYVIARPKYVFYFRDNGYNVLAPHVHYLDKNEKICPMGPGLQGSYTKDLSYMLMFNNANCRSISLIEKIYRPPLEKTTLGMDKSKPPSITTPSFSLLPHLCSLTFFAKKINVYGWDFYMKSSPEKMNYWQLFFSMYNFKLDSRSHNYFEGALINYYYGYQFSKMSNFKIHGYMGKLGKHEKLIKRIERVLFN